MNKFTLALVIFAQISLILAEGSPDYVIELCRHGARGPSSDMFDNTWPKWQYENLTPTGMRQHYVLGKALSEKYPDFFNPATSDNINVMSEGGNRTTMSAMSQLYGLFMGSGPAFSPDFQSDIALPPYDDNATILPILNNLTNAAVLPNNYYPVSHSLAQGGDHDVIEPLSNCKNYKIWEALSIVSARAFYTWDNFTVLQENLAKYDFVLPMNNPIAMVGLADTVDANYFEGKEFPGGMPTDADLLTNFTFCTSYYASLLSYGNDVKINVAATPMVLRLLEVLQSAVEGSLKPKFTLYSGHDVGLLALMSAFKMVSPECILENFLFYWENNRTMKYPYCVYPNYAATIIFEVYKNGGNPQIQVLYNDIPLPLCNGNSMCGYDEFVTFAKNSIDNWTMEQRNEVCGGDPPPSAQKEEKIEKVRMMREVEPSKVSADARSIANFALVIVILGLSIYSWGLRKENKKLKRSQEYDELAEQRIEN